MTWVEAAKEIATAEKAAERARTAELSERQAAIAASESDKSAGEGRA